MRAILRMGLAVVLATVLAVTTAWAVDYDDIFELTERGVSDRTIVQLIVDDGRAFELSADELADLRAAGVSEVVIDAMLDPAVGRAWLGGGSSAGGTGGYATSLDEAYGQGYSAGVSNTALVFSFGYYYGPLARYYYVDPFYYPFWYSGYSYAYWPSYYSYWYRPYYDYYYAYPYNWYGYNSYYCHSYYDAGYWAHNGYYVPPGYGHSVWDDGPRFRGGGVTPPKGGRPDGTGAYGRVADGSVNRMRNPAAPPAIREAESGRAGSDRGARVESGSRAGRGVEAPSARTPSSRSSSSRVIRGSESATGNSRGATSARVIRGSGRTTANDRVSSAEPRRLRDSAERVQRGGRSTDANGRTVRRGTSTSSRVIRSANGRVADGRAGMVERGATARVERAAGYSRSGGGGRGQAAAPSARSGGGGGRGQAAAPSARSGGGGGRSNGGGGGAPRGGGGNSHSGSHGNGGGGRGGR